MYEANGGQKSIMHAGRLVVLLTFCLLLPVLHATPTYQETIRPILQESCLNCHNPDKNKAGLDLSTYDATMDGSDNGKVVTPGNPEKSVLYKVLTHAEEPFMPKNGDKLPDPELDAIREWIEASAPEKAGGALAKANAGPSIAVVPVEEKPAGPPVMPKDIPLQPYVRTMRPGAVPSVAGSPWSPLVALAAQKQILLYNTDSLDLAGVLPFPEGFPAVVRFSHNGSLLIAGGGVGAKLGHVVIWDVVTGRRIAQVGDEFDTVLAADISPDQSLVALGGPSRLVKIFSASTGKMLCKMKKHTDWVTALSFTPDGKSLISGDRAGGLSVWDTQGHELQSMSDHTAAITGIACRGNLVATSSEDGTVKFWDIIEGKQIKSWLACPAGVRSVAFTPDGHIVTSDRDHLVRLWSATGAPVKTFEPLNDIAMQACCAGGKIIAADWSGLVRVYTQEGKRAGDLDSNPPTIAQRIDYLNQRIADLPAIQARTQAEAAAASAALAAARDRVASRIHSLYAKQGALAAAQKRLPSLQKQVSILTAAIQKSRQDKARVEAAMMPLACASALNPLLQPKLVYNFTVRSLIARSLANQTTTLARARTAINSARFQCDALPGQISALIRSNPAAAAAVKRLAMTFSAAQAAAAQAMAESQWDRARLAKWQAAATRLASDPQYASLKAGSK